MRIMVFFDLPTETYGDRRDYTLFRKFLLGDGFIMMQKSVYCKLALNKSIVNSELKRLKQHKPKKGVVEVLIITEKQFSQIEYLVGEKETNTLDGDNRLVIL